MSTLIIHMYPATYPSKNRKNIMVVTDGNNHPEKNENELIQFQPIMFLCGTIHIGKTYNVPFCTPFFMTDNYCMSDSFKS